MRKPITSPESSSASAGLTRRGLLRLAGLGMLAAPALVLNACTTSRENTQYVVKIQDVQSQDHFMPVLITVPRGSTITWQNITTYPHSVTCDLAKAKNIPYVALPSGATPFDSGYLYPGQTWSYTFNVPGTYLYFSSYDPSPNIVGQVHVSG